MDHHTPVTNINTLQFQDVTINELLHRILFSDYCQALEDLNQHGS